MIRFLRERWFLLLLATALVVGFGFSPGLLELAQRVPQSAIVSLVLFLMAISVDSEQLGLAVKQPLAVGLAVGVNFGLLPLVAWGATWLLREDLAHGLMVAAAVPSTLASAAVWTRQAGGNDAVAVMSTLVTNASCFLVTPLWLAATTGRAARIDPLPMMAALALTVVAPMMAGQCARRYQPLAAWAQRNRARLGAIAQLGILTIVLVGAVHGGRRLRETAGTAQGLTALDLTWMVVVVTGVHTAMLAAGHLLGAACGLRREERIAVGFSGSQKTLMVGLDVSLRAFGGVAMLPMVAFHVCQLLVDTLVADWLRRGAPQSARLSPEAPKR